MEAPYSLEAEEAVLGAVLTDPQTFTTIAAFLKHDDFFFLKHSYIWQAIQYLNERKLAIDFITVTQRLNDLNVLQEIGGAAYLMQLISKTPTSVHVEVYAHIVERAAIRRRLLTVADEIQLLARDEQMEIDSVVSEAEARLLTVTDRQVKRDFVPMKTAVDEYFNRLEYVMNNRDASYGVPTGFRDLDSLLGGLQRSDLLIFAGRPGMGKTSFLLSSAVNAARLGARIGIFTLEMGVEQLTQRMISMETGISAQKLRAGQLNSDEYNRTIAAASRIDRLPIFIDDTPALDPIQMRTKCRRLQHEFGVDLIILDYMQLMNAGGQYQNNRVQEISYISRALKELARELDVPLFSAEQLSRAVEQRQDKRPVLSDLRESGCLTGEAQVYLPDLGQSVPIRALVGLSGFRVTSLNLTTWKLEPGVVTHAFCTGVQPVYKLSTRRGRSIRATGNHKFLTLDGWRRVDALTTADHIALPRQTAPGLVPAAVWLAHLLPQTTDATALCTVMGLPVEGVTPATSLTRDTLAQAGRHLDAERVVNLAEGEVFWDQIASITRDGEELVYDLTVEDQHNFLVNGIVSSNSIEQDADIVMFLYRDAVYNEATEFPNQADVIVAKHRNGPTGSISLFFDMNVTKFVDAEVRQVNLGED